MTRNNIWGMISGWVNPSSTEDCPLIFEVPNYWLVHEWIREEEIYHVGLTAFSEGALFYENAEAFMEASPKNIQMREKGGDAPIPVRGYSPNHFIPTDRFSEVYEGSEPTSTAMFAGAVKDLRLITNEKTKCSFYWMNVETLFGELDVVCSKRGLNAEPHIGGILDGYFYLVGRIHLD